MDNRAKKWQAGQIENYEDNSEEMLKIFDGQPQTYINWATNYFEETYKESGILLNTVSKIYSGETLTKKMVISLAEQLKDWEQLENDLTKLAIHTILTNTGKRQQAISD